MTTITEKDGDNSPQCFGCDEHPIKYVDGLCEKCHQIAMGVSKEIKAEKDEDE